jgi:Tfp pilus assembly protein PilN
MVSPGFNLATRDYRREGRQRHLLAGVALLLVVCLAGQVGAWALLRQRDQAIATRLAAMEAELRRHTEEVRTVKSGVSGEAVKRYQARVAALNQILEAAAFSWSGFLAELERSVPPGVLLNEIQPDPVSGQVSLRGTAKGFTELGRLLHGLEERPVFTNVFLLRQAERRLGAIGPEVLDFSVAMTYRGHRS